jgi:hypothetical protein
MISPRKWVKQRTNGTIRKCSSRALQWMVMSVCSDNLNFLGQFPCQKSPSVLKELKENQLEYYFSLKTSFILLLTGRRKPTLINRIPLIFNNRSTIATRTFSELSWIRFCNLGNSVFNMGWQRCCPTKWVKPWSKTENIKILTSYHGFGVGDQSPKTVILTRKLKETLTLKSTVKLHQQKRTKQTKKTLNIIKSYQFSKVLQCP